VGQYYKPVNLESKEHIHAHEYGEGLKLMEHSYLGNTLVTAVESLLIPKGKWHKKPLVWAGDYAENEGKSEMNIYHLSVIKIKPKSLSLRDSDSYRFIVNHTKKEYVDKKECPEIKDWPGAYIHPLPLLTCEGNGGGGGDYYGNNKYVGVWARDIISIERTEPKGYTKIKPDFIE
jgi:hypothetical protein